MECLSVRADWWKDTVKPIKPLNLQCSLGRPDILGQLSEQAVLEDDARHAACCAAPCFAPLECVLHYHPFCRPCTSIGTPFDAEGKIFRRHSFTEDIRDTFCCPRVVSGPSTTDCRCLRPNVVTQPSLYYNS